MRPWRPIDLEAVPEYFWDRIIPEGPGRHACWIWFGPGLSNGYGLVQINGEQFLVHRVAWALEHSKDPGDLTICHRCDNVFCARPSHLFAGTLIDNNLDMWLKGKATGARGRKSPRAVVGEQEVVEIRALKGVPMRELGELYGLTISGVSAIQCRRSWAWL